MLTTRRHAAARLSLEPDVHALYPRTGERQSLQPLVSLCWLNVIYIVTSTPSKFPPELKRHRHGGNALATMLLRQARDAQWWDYVVTALKNHGAADGVDAPAARDDAQMAEFRHFIAREGESLTGRRHSTLHAYQVKEDEQRWGWPARRRRTCR